MFEPKYTLIEVAIAYAVSNILIMVWCGLYQWLKGRREARENREKLQEERDRFRRKIEAQIKRIHDFRQGIRTDHRFKP